MLLAKARFGNPTATGNRTALRRVASLQVHFHESGQVSVTTSRKSDRFLFNIASIELLRPAKSFYQSPSSPRNQKRPTIGCLPISRRPPTSSEYASRSLTIWWDIIFWSKRSLEIRATHTHTRTQTTFLFGSVYRRVIHVCAERQFDHLWRSFTSLDGSNHKTSSIPMLMTRLTFSARIDYPPLGRG